MNTATRPIAATTSLSILLHGVVFAALVLVFEQTTTIGQGLEIQLIRSAMVSNQQETDIPRNSETVPTEQDAIPENEVDNAQKQVQKQRLASQAVLTSLNSAALIPDADSADKEAPVERQDVVSLIEKNVNQKREITDKGESIAQIVQSTNAIQQQYSIVALLHTRISDNKEYPYIARRQRREGIATVGFVLHPDGTIENAHLVTSSSAGALDRAALSAVKRIEPFEPAQDYLDQSEEFKIDVVFKLL